MKIGYARVSTDGQSLDKQIDMLSAEGISKRCIYKEKMTGTSKERPELVRMLEEIENGDEVVICDLTRISRSTRDLLSIIDEIKEKGATIRSLKDTWLNTTSDNPYTGFLLTVMAGLSQLERDLVSVRTKESLKARRLRGKLLGRPAGGPRKKNEEIIKLFKQGMGPKDISSVLENVSKRTIQRVLKDFRNSVE